MQIDFQTERLKLTIVFVAHGAEPDVGIMSDYAEITDILREDGKPISKRTDAILQKDAKTWAAIENAAHEAAAGAGDYEPEYDYYEPGYHYAN